MTNAVETTQREGRVHLDLAEVEDLAIQVLTRAGLSQRHALPVAAQFAAAEADGIPSHGLARVPSTAAMVMAGKIAADPEPVITFPKAGVVHVEGRDGFPHLAIDKARPLLVERARDNGIAVLAVANAYACGVLGYHTERLAAEGLLVMGFTQAPASIAPSGGKRPVIGTNPMSIAARRPDGTCFVIDQSSSVVAKSEVMDRAAHGEDIPSHWAFDREGRPTTSPKAALDGGTMAPFGEYKGFGVGLIVELFAAVYTGSALGLDATPLVDPKTGPSRIGATFIALDAAGVAGAGFGTALERLLAAIADQPGVRVPGERRRAMRARTASEGITIPAKLHQQLLAML
ncbi:Ureidoglycolate dehydrogenase [Hyphomicrobiales bacterium]|nr:Ureidoglycolate dehydrogenase [Hyphomicrobiales bacterium]CAH1695233.1 Ureidoglycolate dehydrogenase [Hyphomicrobiales bacterium]